MLRLCRARATASYPLALLSSGFPLWNHSAQSLTPWFSLLKGLVKGLAKGLVKGLVDSLVEAARPCLLLLAPSSPCLTLPASTLGACGG